jgi:MFS family permease
VLTVRMACPASGSPVSQPDKSPSNSEWNRAALAVLVTVFAMNLLGRGSGETYSVFLLPMEQAFGWSRSQLTSVYSTYLLVGAVVAPWVGTLFDRFGPRIVYSVGIASLAAANVFASTLESIWAFYLYMGAGVGIGVALVGMVPASGLLVRWYRLRLSTAIGLVFAAGGCGTLFFVPVAQGLLNALDWRMTYRVIGMGFLVLLPIVAFAIPWKHFAAGHAEYAAERKQRGDDLGWTLRAALRTRTYWGLAAMFGFTSLGMFIVFPQTVAFLIGIGFTPIVAATAFGFAAMASVFSVSGTGFFAERWGYRRTVTTSFVGSCAGVFVLFLLSLYPVAWLVPFYVVIFGLSQGVRGPIISSICAKRFAGARVATIYGTLYSVNAIGAAMGALAGGILYDLTGGYRTGFIVSIIALTIAALPMWTVRELREQAWMRPSAPPQ